MPRLGGHLDIVQVNDPSTPAVGRQHLYFKSDGVLYTKKSDGTVTAIGTGNGGGAPANMVTTDTTQTITGAKTFTGLFAVQGDDDNYPGIVVQHANDGSRTEVSPDGLYGRASSATAAVPTKAWRLSGTATRWVGISNDVVANLEVRTLADSNSPYWVSNAPIYENDNRVLTTASTIPAPSNMVTTDTEQTITGAKDFTYPGGYSAYLDGTGLYTSAGALQASVEAGRLSLTDAAAVENDAVSIDVILNGQGTSLRALRGPDGGSPRWSTSQRFTAGELYEATNRVYSAANLPPAPSNMITTDTDQTITGYKVFSNAVEVSRATQATSESPAPSAFLSFTSTRWNGSTATLVGGDLAFGWDAASAGPLLSWNSAFRASALYEGTNRVLTTASTIKGGTP